MGRKYPLRLKDTDVSGVSKKDTLEFFLLNPGWHSSNELRKDGLLNHPLLGDDSRAIQMRLTRYTRQGLLARRRKVTRGFDYEITRKGQDRLFYLWDKFGDTNLNRNLTPEDAIRTRGLLSLKQSVLENRLDRLSLVQNSLNDSALSDLD